MSKKFSIVVIAYRNIQDSVKKTIDEYTVRTVDEAADLMNFCSYGRQMDQNSRVCIYLDWYKNSIMKYLSKGYKIAVLEVPYEEEKKTVQMLHAIDIVLGDELLVVEYDEI